MVGIPILPTAGTGLGGVLRFGAVRDLPHKAVHQQDENNRLHDLSEPPHDRFSRSARLFATARAAPWHHVAACCDLNYANPRANQTTTMLRIITMFDGYGVNVAILRYFSRKRWFHASMILAVRDLR
jgi:hypothetical protein